MKTLENQGPSTGDWTVSWSVKCQCQVMQHFLSRKKCARLDCLCPFIASSGHYVYIEASSPRGKGDIARLTSDRFKVSSGFNWCLNFWYHMYGNSVGSLSVKLRIYPFNPSRPYYRTLWTEQLNHGDVWLSNQVQLNSPDNFEVWA